MLTRPLAASVASSWQEIPGATSFHSGSPTQRSSGAGDGSPPESAAMRPARRPHRAVGGRKMSIGQSLVRCEGRQRLLQQAAPAPYIHGVLRPLDLLRGAAVWTWRNSLLALVEPEAIDGSRARLIHDPAHDRSIVRIVLRGPQPDV